MLEVTDAAINHLGEAIESQEVGEAQAFRLVESAPQQLGLTLGEEQEGDQVFTRGDRTVLLVDPEISGTLDGAVLDTAESPDGTSLTLRPAEIE